MKSKVIIGLVCLIIGLPAGFFAGRKTTAKTVKIEQVKGDPVAGLVTGIQPVSEETPAVPILPMKSDTVYIDSIRYVVQSVDTAAIIREYELIRMYSQTLFDDQYGKLDLNLSTQYNRLNSIEYVFTPIYTVKTVEIKPVWIPFVSASYSTFNQVSVGGGVFYHDIGIKMEYVANFKAKGLDIGLLYKF
ncbi:MAG: hypothetical protein LBQ39_08560 [Tannerellaceae bacterium]|jgi:hypothetical protein|nr:hypothetical protein [Tannerellaceae bacterium]